MRKLIYIMATTVFAASASMVAAMEYDTDNILSGTNQTSVPESKDSLDSSQMVVVTKTSAEHQPIRWDYSAYTNTILKQRAEEAEEKARRDAADRLAWEEQKVSDVDAAERLAPTLLDPGFAPGTSLKVGKTKVGLRKTISGVYLNEPGSPTKGMKSPAPGQGRKVATPPDTTRGITTSNDFGH